jgi:hypothetical protein
MTKEHTTDRWIRLTTFVGLMAFTAFPMGRTAAASEHEGVPSSAEVVGRDQFLAEGASGAEEAVGAGTAQSTDDSAPEIAPGDKPAAPTPCVGDRCKADTPSDEEEGLDEEGAPLLDEEPPLEEEEVE